MTGSPHPVSPSSVLIFKKGPAGWDLEKFQLSDFHGNKSSMGALTILTQGAKGRPVYKDSGRNPKRFRADASGGLARPQVGPT